MSRILKLYCKQYTMNVVSDKILLIVDVKFLRCKQSFVIPMWVHVSAYVVLIQFS